MNTCYATFIFKIFADLLNVVLLSYRMWYHSVECGAIYKNSKLKKEHKM